MPPRFYTIICPHPIYQPFLSEYSVTNSTIMSDQETHGFEIRPIPGYGLGVTATAHISRGDLIMSEAPLITVDGSSVDGVGGIESSIVKSLKSLPKDDQRAYLSLHNCHGTKLSPILGIFKTNSIQLGVHEADAGIFLQISRINHSCVRPHVLIATVQGLT